MEDKNTIIDLHLQAHLPWHKAQINLSPLSELGESFATVARRYIFQKYPKI